MNYQNKLSSRYKSLWWLLPLLVGACSDDMQNFRTGNENDALKLELWATIEQTVTTRADETGFANDDRIGVFVVNHSDNQSGKLTLTENQVNNVAVSYVSDQNSWLAATNIYWRDEVTPADVYGYYPFDNGMANVEAYAFTVASNQSISASDGELGGYEASDFLWAKNTSATPGKRVDLRFNHIMAGVKVILQRGNGFDGDSWDKLTKIVTVDNTLRNSEIDLSTGNVTATGSFDRHVIMNPDGEDVWRAVVVPQFVESGQSVIGITLDGVTYNYTRTDGMKYTSGKLHSFTISVDRKDNGGAYELKLVDEDIIPWETDNTSHDFVENAYMTVSCPEPGKLREVLNNEGIDFATIRNLKVTGTLTTEDFMLLRDELLSLTALNLKDVKIVNTKLVSTDYQGNWLEETEVDDMIPEEAFRDKSSLRRMVLPDGIKRIGYGSFMGLSINSTLEIPESVTCIDAGAFQGMREGATIILPHNLDYLGSDAFYECKAEIEICLTNSIKYIGRYAFWGSSNAYGTLNLPANLEYLGEGALPLGNRCEGELVIPAGLTEIPDNAFMGLNLKGGTKVIFHDGVTRIGKSAFEGINFASGFSLPSNLKEIGEDAFSNCHFVGGISIPSSVQVMGTKAFYGTNLNGKLNVPNQLEMLSPTPLGDCGYAMGTFAYSQIEEVEIGDNIEMIGGRAFCGCGYLRTVEIGKNVDRIGMEAFAYCPGLQRIVCYAKEPPKLYNDVFLGFDPQHCHLEVPEESVDAYKRADGWKNFQFISPYRELSVGFHQLKVLNKGISRKVIVDAEGKWRVKESPSWVRIIPDHSEGKEEITIEVDVLPLSSGERTGNIVFELEEKDYSTECEVIQYDYESMEDSEIKLHTASGDGTPVNIFIVGDGFGAEEIVSGRYMELMHSVADDLLSIEPYKSYADHFNISTAVAVSPDNGVASYNNPRIDRLGTYGTELDVAVVKKYAIDTMEAIDSESIRHAMLIVVANQNAFEGSAYPDEDGSALCCISICTDAYPYDQRGLVQHYAGGQAFAGLAPEYVSHNEHIKGCTCPYCNSLQEYYTMKSKGMFENISMTGKMNDVPWKEFIFHPKYSGIVDIWEGGFNHLAGIWRSESQSVMGTYIPYYNTMSRYAIYKAIMRRANLSASLDDFIMNDIIELPEL